MTSEQAPSKDQLSDNDLDLPIRACRPWQEPSDQTQPGQSTPEPPADHSKCPFCDRPCDDTGSIWHVTGCEGLQDAGLNRLQHYWLSSRASQPPLRASQPPSLLRQVSAIAYDTSKAADDRIREIQALWEGAEQPPSPEDARDAARWRALIGCARVRVLGSAGLRDPESKYAHIGVELWTQYPDALMNEAHIETLTAFADRAVLTKEVKP